MKIKNIKMRCILKLTYVYIVLFFFMFLSRIPTIFSTLTTMGFCFDLNCLKLPRLLIFTTRVIFAFLWDLLLSSLTRRDISKFQSLGYF